jgi:hypothetical protein
MVVLSLSNRKCCDWTWAKVVWIDRPTTTRCENEHDWLSALFAWVGCLARNPHACVNASASRLSRWRADCVHLQHIFGTFGAPLLSSPTTLVIECCILAHRVARTKDIPIGIRVINLVAERCGKHRPTLHRLFHNIWPLATDSERRLAEATIVPSMLA